MKVLSFSSANIQTQQNNINLDLICQYRRGPRLVVKGLSCLAAETQTDKIRSLYAGFLYLYERVTHTERMSDRARERERERQRERERARARERE